MSDEQFKGGPLHFDYGSLAGRIETIHGTRFVFVSGHAATVESIRALRDWLTSILPDSAPTSYCWQMTWVQDHESAPHYDNCRKLKGHDGECQP